MALPGSRLRRAFHPVDVIQSLTELPSKFHTESTHTLSVLSRRCDGDAAAAGSHDEPVYRM